MPRWISEAKLSGKQLNKMEAMMVMASAKAVNEVTREQSIQQEPGLFIWDSSSEKETAH